MALQALLSIHAEACRIIRYIGGGLKASLWRSPPVHDAVLEHVRHAGATILPPDVFKAVDSTAFKAVAGSSAAVVFATGGERGAVKLWRSDTGQCILEQRQARCTDLASLRSQTAWP